MASVLASPHYIGGPIVVLPQMVIAYHANDPSSGFTAMTWICWRFRYFHDDLYHSLTEFNAALVKVDRPAPLSPILRIIRDFVPPAPNPRSYPYHLNIPHHDHDQQQQDEGSYRVDYVMDMPFFTDTVLPALVKIQKAMRNRMLHWHMSHLTLAHMDHPNRNPFILTQAKRSLLARGLPIDIVMAIITSCIIITPHTSSSERCKYDPVVRIQAKPRNQIAVL